MHISSYATVYALGHKAILDIFSSSVVVQEKIDGSQFSMARTESGELVCRSKSAEIQIDEPEKMFKNAVDTAKSLDLRPGWVYRCEYLSKPKHNTLAYDRTPNKYLIVFDIDTGTESYVSQGGLALECERLGLEYVPLFYEGKITGMADLDTFLDQVSVLGGSKIEGVVVKNYDQFTPEKKVAMGKFVSERFKEIHNADWKERNPSTKDIVTRIVDKYRSEARWEKAIQHLRDAGSLTESPKDIGALIKAVPEDILTECADEIMEALFTHIWPDIRRGVTRGLPEWYKRKLAETSFPTG